MESEVVPILGNENANKVYINSESRNSTNRWLGELQFRWLGHIMIVIINAVLFTIISNF